MTADGQDLFNHLDALSRGGSAFAAYRLPKSGEVVVIDSPSGVECLDRVDEVGRADGFVAIPFDTVGSGCPLVLIRPGRVNRYAVGEAGIPVNLEGLHLEARPVDGRAGEGYDDYARAFAAFDAALGEGLFSKLVLARRKTFAVDEAHAVPLLFCRAVRCYPEAFVYVFHTPQSGTWFGSTPEILLSGGISGLRTVALAGTRLRSREGEHKPWDDKNTMEQGFVADYVASVLRGFGIDDPSVETATVGAGRVEHRCSTFTFACPDGVRPGQLAAALHPTPAVCGLPKDEALAFIRRHEACCREYYAGFIGPVGLGGRVELFVNLRCLNAVGTELRLFAGGGIVRGSELGSEWRETENKMRTMLDLL